MFYGCSPKLSYLTCVLTIQLIKTFIHATALEVGRHSNNGNDDGDNEDDNDCNNIRITPTREKDYNI